VSPARWPRGASLDERLLVIDPAAGSYADAHVRDLGRWLRPGDLLVVNDAATLPASLDGKTADGAPLEVRLLSEQAPGKWSAVLFGKGDWRTRTEDRAAPAPVSAGTVIGFGPELEATVTSVSDTSRRLVGLSFHERGAKLWGALYARGRPVQYSHLAGPLALWHVQTAYGARPWAAEMPSAGRPLTWDLLLDVKRAGVDVAALTHAAGLSATGDPALDVALPLRERYDIPQATVEAIEETRARSGRVVAVGTTVVRALEGCAFANGKLVSGEGTTDLRLDAGARLAVVDGLLTGLHDTSASHFRLVQAFADRALIERAYVHAEEAGYLNHEFGDSNLILRAA
jgi:S-adenosylmethionine:tRNA ribosyltransferase-isomerase